jgi:hypothetical protein
MSSPVGNTGSCGPLHDPQASTMLTLSAIRRLRATGPVVSSCPQVTASQWTRAAVMRSPRTGVSVGVVLCARGPASGSRSRPVGESVNRPLVIERANLGAEGSHQLVVLGGRALDETPVRLMVVAGPVVGRVCGIAGLPHG